MKLSLENIGKIENAVIELNGITVIGGENDTGKSTVGKALYSIFDCFYHIPQIIFEERLYSIKNFLRLITRNYMKNHIVNQDIDEIAREILAKSEVYKNAPEELREYLISKFELDLEVDKEDFNAGELNNRIVDILNVSDEMIFNLVVDKKIIAEFDGQLRNIYSDSEGKLSLEMKGKSFCISMTEDSVFTRGSDYSLNSEAIYIDDPFVLDNITNFNLFDRYINHRIRLIRKILATKENENVIDELLIEKKLGNIYKKILLVCEGDIVHKKNDQFVYRLKDSKKALSIDNLSAGLKMFVILKTLLMNGSLETNGTIILDEPEIHLHPEWQLLFAEIIVLLQKEFNMNILLNTHSPYFLRAIQVYSVKYGINDVCKYYLSEINNKGNATITDVTDHVDMIFAKLSKPLQKLEDEEWNIDEF